MEREKAKHSHDGILYKLGRWLSQNTMTIQEKKTIPLVGTVCFGYIYVSWSILLKQIRKASIFIS